MSDLTPQYAENHQGQDAVKRMDAQFLVGPVEGGSKRQEVRVLHASKGFFDVILTAVAQDNLLIGPVVPVGKENGLAKQGGLEFFPCILAKLKR